MNKLRLFGSWAIGSKVRRWLRGTQSVENRRFPKQFGKIHGIALAILGIVLLGIQTVYYMMPTTVISGPMRLNKFFFSASAAAPPVETALATINARVAMHSGHF